MADFAEKLKRLREDAALSQNILAQMSGVTRQSISQLEMGEYPPTWETVQRLALALQVDATRLTDDELTVPGVPLPAKPRGRPRKHPVATEPAPKKPRGRPRKEKTE